MSEATEERALDILVDVKKSTSTRKGWAAAAVYTAGIMEGDKKSQWDVAEAADMNAPTLRKYYKLIKAAQLSSCIIWEPRDTVVLP